MERKKSFLYFKEAREWVPGGVNSPVRALKAVEGSPLFMEKAEGAYLYDVDGNRYLDFIGSWGPAVLGHAHPQVIRSLKKVLASGLSFGMSCPLEVKLAKLICHHVPGAEMIRFLNSGTEAAMTALRLARAFTGRDKIVKFEGCYHGHSDGLLVKAGSGGATFGIPTSPGVPQDYIKNTITLPYNDPSSFQSFMAKNGDEVAAVIVEPVAGNMGVIVPSPEFIDKVIESSRSSGSVLIFDEVMTGFRVHKKGAQGYFGVKADLVCLGKIIGGGLPVGAVAGKKNILSRLAPEGDVYQAGTLSGNPLAMAAGLATLEIFFKEKALERIESIARVLRKGLEEIKQEYSEISFEILGGMFTLFFTPEKPQNFNDVNKCDLKRFGRFFNFLLERQILIPPSQFEANFLSLSHTRDHINLYLEAVREFLAE